MKTFFHSVCALTLASALLVACSGGTPPADGGTGGDDGGTGGGAAGGGTGGGAAGGGSGGGAAGGGSGGGAAGGGSGGGAAGGGAGGGGIPGTCTLGQACTNANEQCLLVANGGSTATACVAGACDTVAQNCSNTAQMCTYLGELDGGVNRACVNAPTSGVAQDGDCSAAQCQKGLTCVTLSGQTTPRCLKYCATDGNCDSTHVCNLALTITGTNERPLVCGVRPATCDLLAQNCTNAGDGCYATTSGNVCLPAGTAADGGSCGQSALCVKGQTCVDVNSSGNKCYALCNPDGGSPACSGAACNALTQPVGVGICL